nr:hypothetical protein [Deinococcus yavapaiensis]
MRIHRDFFHDPAMHGLDRASGAKRDRAFLPHVGQREGSWPRRPANAWGTPTPRTVTCRGPCRVAGRTFGRSLSLLAHSRRLQTRSRCRPSARRRS